MRCVICDASDQGLSDYRNDWHVHAKHFHRVGDDVYCDDCMSSIDEATNELFEQDEELED